MCPQETRERLDGGAEDLGRAGRTVTLRAMAVACALMPLLALWVVQAELIWYSGHSTAISLFFHVTFVVFLLALGNLLVQRRWPERASMRLSMGGGCCACGAVA